MTAAVPLIESLPAAWSAQPAGGLPAWYRERQRRALDAAMVAPWPTRSAEAWKYTALQRPGAFPMQAPMHDSEPGEASLAGSSVPGITFLDGDAWPRNSVAAMPGIELQPLSRVLREDPEAARFALAREPEEGDVFDRLNAAFARDGAWMSVAAGATSETWTTLAWHRRPTVASHLGHRIDIGEGADVRIHIDLRAPGTVDNADGAANDGISLSTLLTRIRVQRGARLELAWTAPAHAEALIARTRIELEHEAALVMSLVDAGGAPSRHDLRVVLRGERARAQLAGVFLLEGGRHADMQLDLRHEARNTSSATAWRAIADGAARAVFDGHIKVAHGADGTDAQLSCKSLALSPKAEIDAKPVLEIYTDDVKCAHGATVGQLDEQALFYLRSRGLSEADARALLLRAFAVEALVDLPATPVREVVGRQLGAVDA